MLHVRQPLSSDTRHLVESNYLASYDALLQ